jgi:hypothetical protein
VAQAARELREMIKEAKAERQPLGLPKAR